MTGKGGLISENAHVLGAEGEIRTHQNRPAVYQLTSRACLSTCSATSSTRANSAIRTSMPLSVWRKIARFGLSFRSSSSSRVLSRESVAGGA